MGRLIWLLPVLLLLTGCGGNGDPYRVDTVIRPPADMTPAEKITAPAAEIPAETAVPTLPDVDTMPIFAPPLPTIGWETEQAPPARQPENSVPESGGTEPTVAPETAATLPPAPDIPALTEPPAVQNDVRTDMESRVRSWVDGFRSDAGCDPLEWDDALAAAAACRARELALLWSHNRPDGTGWDTVLRAYGCDVTISAELLCYGPEGSEAAALASAWAGSPDHRKKLLDGGFTREGVGVFSENGTIYLCVLLAG